MSTHLLAKRLGNSTKMLDKHYSKVSSRLNADLHSRRTAKKASTSNDQLEITAETKDGIIMGIMHKEYNIHGVQFHPESIKTMIGIKILKNFINYKSTWKFT